MSGKILIVDDLATSRIVLKARLGKAFYDILQAADGETALALARRAAPDLVLLELDLPDMPGTEVCARLRADPLTALLPIVFITAETSPDARLKALSAGADDCVSKPVDESLLLARLRSLIRARAAEAEVNARDATCRELGFADTTEACETPARVGIVTSSPAAGIKLGRALSDHLPARIETLTRAEALADRSAQAPPEGFILAGADCDAGADAALDLMAELRSRTVTRHAAILVTLPGGCSAGAAMALDLGAGDVVIGDIDPRELALRMKRLIRRQRRMEQLRASVNAGLRLAVTDPLTGLYNRRYALPHLGRIAERARATRQPFAVMVLDLDRFKSVNDTWGHGAGDKVLADVAMRLAANLRAADLLARIGGEEFLVVMPDADLGIARRTAERLCRLIEATPIVLASGTSIALTMSIGVAIGDPTEAGGAEALALLERADRALLGAKSDGRNQVTIDRPAA